MALGVAAFSASHIFVTGSANTSTPVPANQQRVGLLFFNDSNQTVYIGYGPVSGSYSSLPASAVNTTNRFAFKLATQGFYEVENNYVGPISVVWQTTPTTGSLVITDLSSA